MQQALVITFITEDKPGVVDKLSQTIMNSGGNWLESRMTKLAGKFTGIVQVSVHEDSKAALITELKALEDNHFSLLINELHHSETSNTQTLELSFIGLDRPGIVQEFAKALAQKSLNVAKMHSVIESAPMSSEPLFKGEADIEAPKDLDIDTLEDDIEAIANKLDLEWSLTLKKI